ncbi:hypothetical protein SSIG_02943 [Streptomyces filamentosus NRRL 11379]|nr:hypothetical protein SSIG_02943 [Streptomyces filamentosus NRRL 11379]
MYYCRVEQATARGGYSVVVNQLVESLGTGNTEAMTEDREALIASWKRTRAHLDAARAYFAPLPGINLSTTLEFLEHNELGLAFDCLVHLADDLGLPLGFWQHMDRAAREMRLYSDEPHMPHRKAADSCLRHLAAASGQE